MSNYSLDGATNEHLAAYGLLEGDETPTYEVYILVDGQKETHYEGDDSAAAWETFTGNVIAAQNDSYGAADTSVILYNVAEDDILAETLVSGTF